MKTNKNVWGLLFIMAVAAVGLASHYVWAQSIGAGAGCTITAKPPVSTGAPVKLYYEVVNKPTSMSLSATDDAANPVDDPTVGNPDATRVDANAVGNIMTRAITKDTTFTMTVSNGVGESTCTVKVYYKQKSSGGWQVGLVSQTPIFNRLQIPGGYDTTAGYMPFLSSYWVKGGYFVVNGFGNSGVADGGARAGSPIAILHGKPTKFESGGLYGFSEAGKLLGVRDVTFDTSSRAKACFEGGGCTASNNVSPVGPGQFLRDLNGGAFARSPIVYSIGSSGVKIQQRLFFNDRGYDNTSLPSDPVGRLERFYSAVTSASKIIGVARRNAGYVGGRPTVSYSTEVYDINFNRLASYSAPIPTCTSACSGVPPTSAPTLVPVIGIGEYFIAQAGDVSKKSMLGTGGLGANVVYRMPSTDDLLQGKAPQQVQVLPGNYSRFVVDAADGTRIAMFSGHQVTIYKASGSGLTQESQKTISVDAFGIPNGDEGHVLSSQDIAFAGDYLAYGQCPTSSDGGHGNWTPWDGERGGLRFNGCELVVYKISTGKTLAVEPLPLPKYTDFGFVGLGNTVAEPQAVGSVAMSPSGVILVATGACPPQTCGGGENGNIYLYKVNAKLAGTTPTTPTTYTPTTPQASAFDYSDLLNVLSQSLLQMQANMHITGQ